MPQFEHIVSELSDQAAIRIVRAIALAESSTNQVAELTPEIQYALSASFLSSGEIDGPTGDGELARATLLWLGSDPVRANAITALAEYAPDGRFLEPGTIALSTAVLILLQTHVRFERRADGKWSLKVEKKPASESLLKSLVEKIVHYRS